MQSTSFAPVAGRSEAVGRSDGRQAIARAFHAPSNRPKFSTKTKKSTFHNTNGFYPRPRKKPPLGFWISPVSRSSSLFLLPLLVNRRRTRDQRNNQSRSFAWVSIKAVSRHLWLQSIALFLGYSRSGIVHHLVLERTTNKQTKSDCLPLTDSRYRDCCWQPY